MTPSKIVSIVSALFGAIGTVLLFKGSYAFETPTSWMSDEIEKAMQKRNAQRRLLQTLGLSSLLISFVLAGIAQFLD
jgi:hypothetical protein